MIEPSYIARVVFTGRPVPPGPTYRAVVRFDEDNGPASPDAWSLALFYISPPANDVVLAAVEFVAPSAPIERLRRRATFALYEGRHEVARGQVIVARPSAGEDVDVYADPTASPRAAAAA